MSEKYVCDGYVDPDKGLVVHRLHPRSPAPGYDTPEAAVEGALATAREACKRTRAAYETKLREFEKAERAYAQLQQAVDAKRVVVV